MILDQRSALKRRIKKLEKAKEQTNEEDVVLRIMERDSDIIFLEIKLPRLQKRRR